MESLSSELLMKKIDMLSVIKKKEVINFIDLLLVNKNKKNIKKKRISGTAIGKIKISDDFEKPLDESIIAEFYK